MALEFQKMPIVFKGLSEHENPKTEIPGQLRRCENAIFPKSGRIDKRRGYLILDLLEDTDGEIIDPYNLFCNVANYQDQLIVVGYDTLYTVASRTQSVVNADLIRRGPTLRGNIHVGSPVITTPHTGLRPT